MYKRQDHTAHFLQSAQLRGRKQSRGGIDSGEQRGLVRDLSLIHISTGEDREAVLKRVEADRLEQIQRAQAAAERRVERRQGLSIGGQIKEKLLTQARELRARIGQQLGRVKEWIAERFPDPLQQIKERSRDLFDTVVEKAQRALGREAGQEQAADKTATPKRGIFDGLNLKAGARNREREAFTEVRLSAAERAPETAQQLSLIHI